MTETSRFWEATSYSDEDFAQVLNRFFTDGVIGGVTNELAVSAGTGMNLSVATGEAFVHGAWYQNDAAATVTCSASDPSNPRIDRVVLRRTVSSNTCVLAVLTGTPAGSPSAPSLTQSASVWEISLAQVAIAAGATSVGAITSERDIKANGTPKGLIAFIASSTIPTGWAEYTAARGRYIVGVPSGGTIAGTVGSAMTNLQTLGHSHTYNTVIAHTHSVSVWSESLSTSTAGVRGGTLDGSNGTVSGAATSTGSATGTTADNTTCPAPYIQLMGIQKS